MAGDVPPHCLAMAPQLLRRRLSHQKLNRSYQWPSASWVWCMLLLGHLPQHAAGQWVFLGYILGDNDLECEAIPNMQAMARGLLKAAPGSIDVLLNVDRQTGSCARSQTVDFPSTSWTTDRDILLQPGGKWSVLQDYGEVNQATVEGLSSFIKRGLIMYPPSATRKYMLIIWDHGSAFEGAGLDTNCVAGSEQSTRSCGWLMLDNILQGIQNGLQPYGLPKFDILGFDACLMGNWEVAEILSPVAQTLLFSEQLVPGSGLDYSSLGFMATQPMPDAAAVATRWSNDYITQCSKVWQSGCCMTAITGGGATTGGVPALSAILNNLATTWLNDMAADNTLAAVLVQAGLMAHRVTKDFDQVVDLADFLKQVKSALLASQATEQDAQRIHGNKLTLIDQASQAFTSSLIVFTASNAGGLTGLSIFWPRTSSAIISSSPFLNPLQAYSVAITSWVKLVSLSLDTAAQLRAPYLQRMAAAAPFLPSANWNAAYIMTLTGSVPAPVLMAGDLLVGFTPNPTVALSYPGGVPMQVLRAVPASVSPDKKSMSGNWNGIIYGLSQQLQDAQGNVLVSSKAPLYTEETVTRDASGVITSRTLRATVVFADSCESSVSDYHAGTLVAYTSYAGGEANAKTSFTLFASSTAGQFGAADAGSNPPPLDGAGFLLSATLQSVGFVPKHASIASDDLLSASSQARRSTLSTDDSTATGADDQDGADTESDTSSEDPALILAAWALKQTQALAKAKAAASGAVSSPAGSDAEAGSCRRSLTETDTDFDVREWVEKQEQQRKAPWFRLGASTDDSGARSPASLSQYLGVDTMSEVDPAKFGGVIIPLYFTRYRLPSTSSQGGGVMYARSFAQSACFKWGYVANMSLVEAPMSQWAGTTGLRAEAHKGWAATMTAVDVGGQLLHFDTWSAGGSGSTTVSSGVQNKITPVRMTAQGCKCLTQWYYAANGTTPAPYVGCQKLDGWTAPGCEVVPGSCPAGVTLAITAKHDLCAPIKTLAGCKCSASWTVAGSGTTLFGTCAPRDENHPSASWCQVDTASCPTASRAQGTADRTWDYCAQRTANGCECANAWADAQGNVFHGGCAVQRDNMLKTDAPWCATNTGPTAYTAPNGESTGTTCPFTWDTCLPAQGRLATAPGDTSASQCVLPSLISTPSSLVTPTTPVPAGQLVMHNCLTYDPTQVGSTNVSPWCYIDPNVAVSPKPNPPLALAKATCVADSCAAPLLASCPPKVNSSNLVAACFVQLCNARIRGGDFSVSRCPSDAGADLLSAESTYTSMYTKTIASNDTRNPWLVQYLPGAPTRAGEYCLETRGYPCGVLLMQLCSAVTVSVTGRYALKEQGLTCSYTCLSAASTVWEKIQTAGGEPGKGCADASRVQHVIQSLFQWYNAKCRVEPANLVVKKFNFPTPDTSICPRWQDAAANLTGPFGVISSMVRTVGLFGDEGYQSISNVTLSALGMASQAVAGAAVQAVASNSGMQYNASMACVWQIAPADPEAFHIRLTLQFLSSEFNYDGVAVFTADNRQFIASGDLPLRPALITPTGTTRNPPSLPGAGITFDTSSGAIMVIFTSDSNIQGLGFLATYNTSRTPFVDVPECTPDERLVSVFTAAFTAAAQASWAVVSPDAPCPNPGPSISSLGLSTSSTARNVTAYATGGLPPQASLGAASSATAPEFPETSEPMAAYQRSLAYVCLPPGSYKVLRFDTIGRGAWAKGSTGVYVTEGPLLSMTSSSSNGNGTQGSASSDGLFELCDGFTVPPRPADVVDSPVPWPEGSHSFTYTVDLIGLEASTMKSSFVLARLFLATAMSVGTTTVSDVKLLSYMTVDNSSSVARRSMQAVSWFLAEPSAAAGLLSKVAVSASTPVKPGSSKQAEEVFDQHQPMGEGLSTDSAPEQAARPPQNSEVKKAAPGQAGLLVDWSKFMAMPQNHPKLKPAEVGIYLAHSKRPYTRINKLGAPGLRKSNQKTIRIKLDSLRPADKPVGPSNGWHAGRQDRAVRYMESERVLPEFTFASHQRKLLAGNVTTGQRVQLQMGGYYTAEQAREGLVAFHLAVLSGAYLAALKQAGLSSITSVQSRTDVDLGGKRPLLSRNAIIGIAVGLGGAALLVIIGILVYCLCIRKRAAKDNKVAAEPLSAQQQPQTQLIGTAPDVTHYGYQANGIMPSNQGVQLMAGSPAYYPQPPAPGSAPGYSGHPYPGAPLPAGLPVAPQNAEQPGQLYPMPGQPYPAPGQPYPMPGQPYPAPGQPYPTPGPIPPAQY